MSWSVRRLDASSACVTCPRAREAKSDTLRCGSRAEGAIDGSRQLNHSCSFKAVTPIVCVDRRLSIDICCGIDSWRGPNRQLPASRLLTLLCMTQRPDS